MSDARFLWHMWSTASSYVSLPSSHYAVLSSTLLFIAGPSEPPSLIIIFIIAYILSDPSPPFQLAAAGEESQEKRKGAGRSYGGAHVFSHSWEVAKISSCAGLRSSSKLLRSSSAAVRAVAWCCFWEAESAEGEGSRAQRAVHPTGCFKWVHVKSW